MKHEANIHAVAFANNEEHIATASSDGTARIWSATDGSPRRTLDHETNSVYDLAFSHDGTVLVTACKDGFARVWSVDTGEQVGSPIDHAAPLTAVAISRDGKRIATGGTDKLVKCWHRDNHDQPIVVLAHEGRVRDVTFSPDVRRLLTVGTAVRLWSVETGEQIGPSLLPASPASPSECVFSSGGKHAVIAEHEKGAWMVELPAPLDQSHPDPKLWIEVITRMTMDKDGTLTWIGPDAWNAKRERLAALVGPPASQL